MTEVQEPRKILSTQTQGQNSVSRAARGLMRRALKASLASRHHHTGHPYASLITVALEPDGTPVFLISSLAIHTQNIIEDLHVSVLFDESDGKGDPLAGSRLSVSGTAIKTGSRIARSRFLARHPGAKKYADFQDFSFYRMEITSAHYVGGFGRIEDIPPRELVTDIRDATSLIEAENDIICHMNADHADAIVLFATSLMGAPEGNWRFAGCDPEGCDLVNEDRGIRVEFPTRVTTPQEIRKTLVDLTREARQKIQSG